MQISLNEILNFDNLNNVKVRFNKDNNADFDPIRHFKEDRQALFNGHFHNYGKKSFKEGEIVIGLAFISNNKWLLFDVSRITKDLGLYHTVGYEYEPLPQFEKYLGRLVIHFHNSVQQLIRRASSVMSECIVHQLLGDRFDNDIFPGYENVNISWKEMSRLINKSNWKTALENQKGVYLITDKATGKMYVGSAYGNMMIYGRWHSYIKTCHGGNADLKNIAENHSLDYIKENFLYSILEIYKSTIADDLIIKRESWWKETLLTRKFGYNKN